MTNPPEIPRLIKKMIDLIKKDQNADGSFFSLSSNDIDNFSGAVERQTTFFTANILSCLNSISQISESSLIRERAGRFLLQEKNEQWSFNYWSRSSREREAIPYPDDLDDTFVALAALYGYDKKLINGIALACVAKILPGVEVVPGGPYRTWLVNREAPEIWRDVDIAVNSNVGYFLHTVGVSLPNLAAFIDQKIIAGNIDSLYYPDVCQVIYFISRFYDGEKKLALVEFLMRSRLENGLWRNSLETAMAISTLINFDSIDLLTRRQQSLFIQSIKAEPYAFCIDPRRDGKICYAGSRALTASFCIEALTKIAALEIKKLPNKDPLVLSKYFKMSMLLKIKKMAYAKCLGLSQDLKNSAIYQIDALTDEQIVIVPYLMHYAIGLPQNIPSGLLDELALANLFGWIAYTIYDDFLDGEGKPLLLSAANFFLRELTLQYVALDAQIPGMGNEYTKIMNIIDDANAWEQSHCRAEIKEGVLVMPEELPYLSRDDLARLADRSLGHALPALAVLFTAGYAPDSREVLATLSFFQNYLAARQLHDDAHDWKEDLLRGQINSVGARMLRMGSMDNMPALQKLFWHEALPNVVKDIVFFLDRAREKIQDIGAVGPIFNNPASLFELVDRLQSAADRTLSERDEAIKFLDAYGKFS